MLDLTRFQALTFDCYGTLIDWEAGIFGAALPALEAAGRTASSDQVLEAFSQFEHLHEEGNPAPLYPEVLRRTWLDIAPLLGLKAEAVAAERFGASVHAWPAFPDSASALAVLRRYYRRMGILSNVHLAGIAASRRRLATEAGDPFDFAITAEQTGTYKPNLRHFDLAREFLADEGIEPTRWLHVAQSIFHDHGPAKKLGLASVWIDRRANKVGAGATPVADGSWGMRVTSMAEFAEAVEAAHAGRSLS